MSDYISKTITVSSCHSDISNQCRIKTPCITGVRGGGGGCPPSQGGSQREEELPALLCSKKFTQNVVKITKNTEQLRQLRTITIAVCTCPCCRACARLSIITVGQDGRVISPSACTQRAMDTRGRSLTRPRRPSLGSLTRPLVLPLSYQGHSSWGLINTLAAFGEWRCLGCLGCIRREGASEAAPEAVRQAVGGGCQSGWGTVTVGYKCH